MNQRLEELDILRGFSVIGMLLVIVPGDWGHRFQWLHHADWQGYPLSDMIFPTFLFCVGFALPISLSRRLERGDSTAKLAKHIARRSTLLVLIGVLTNAIPAFDLASLRIPGVLQRIGLCWLVVSWLLIFTEKRARRRGLASQLSILLMVTAGIAGFYWVLLYCVPVPGFGNPRLDSEGSWPAYLDRAIFGVPHLWPYGTTNGIVTYDPEGLLSTLPACINVLLGSALGLLYQNRPESLSHGRLLAGGGVLVLAGALPDAFEILPVIKKIWTPSFALLSVGFSVILLAFLGMTLRFPAAKRLYLPARVYGANALLGFVAPAVVSPWLDRPLPGGEGTSVRALGFRSLHMVLGDERWASFIFSFLFLSVLYVAFWRLYRHKIFWRV